VAGNCPALPQRWVCAPRQLYGSFGENRRKVMPTLLAGTAACLRAPVGEWLNPASAKHAERIIARRITAEDAIAISNFTREPVRPHAEKQR
jgi:hypothetical protein